MTALGRFCGVGTVVALAIGLTACTASSPDSASPTPTSPVTQLGAPGEPNRTLSPEEAAQLGVPEHVEADVRFMQDMIHHHDQALVMTGFVDERTQDRDIRLLAKRMKISQEDEMDLMVRWLQDRVELLERDHGDHGAEPMPGMLTDDQLARLEAATGAEFDRLFLEYMIQHHQGAMQMVEELRTAGGGNEPDIGQFARHVESDQGIEITRMQEMLVERAS